MKSFQQLTSADIIAFVKGLDPAAWIKIGIAGGALLFFTLLIAWPAWLKRPAVRNQVRFLESQIRTVQTLSLKKDEWLKNQQAYQTIIEDGKRRVFKAGESSFLHSLVAKMAKESDIKIVASRPRDFDGVFPAPFDTQYQAVMYDFSLEGSYHRIGAFVSRVETSPKLMRIQKFYIRPQDEDPANQIAEISLVAIASK